MSNKERLLTIILLGQFIPILLLEAFYHVKYFKIKTNNIKYRKLILLFVGIGYLFGFLDLYVVDFIA